MKEDNLSILEKLTKHLLDEIGEDSDREGLIKTPKRVAKSWKFLTQGYKIEVDNIINGAIFHEDYDEMVTINNIDLK